MSTEREAALRRVMDIIPWEKIGLPMSRAMGRRVAAYMERYNASVREQVAAGNGGVTLEDCLDPAKEDDITTAISSLLEAGLEADEKAHGLVGLLGGDVLTIDAYKAMRRRREAERVPHDHTTHVPGCHRCELSKDEAAGDA